MWNERVLNKQLDYDGDAVQKAAFSFIAQGEYVDTAKYILSQVKIGQYNDNTLNTIEEKIKNIQETAFFSGLVILLFWTLQLIILIEHAALISLYLFFIYRFIRSLIKSIWLRATIYWGVLFILIGTIWIGSLLITYSVLGFSEIFFLTLSAALVLSLFLPVFRKVPKKFVGPVWIGLGCSILFLINWRL